jgi:hypothetical protein
MTLIIPETPQPQPEDGGNRHYRRMLKARERALPEYNKKMTAYYRKLLQKKNARLPITNPNASPAEGNR